MIENIKYYIALVKYYCEPINKLGKRGFYILYGNLLAFAIRLRLYKPKQFAIERKQICDNCKLQKKIYWTAICDPKQGGCGCFLLAKQQVSKEKCPNGYWNKKKRKKKRPTSKSIALS